MNVGCLRPALPGGAHPRDRRRALDHPDPAGSGAPRPSQVSRPRSLSGRYQPEYAFGPPQDARGRRHHRAAVLQRASAAGRIRVDRERPRAPPRSQGAETMGRKAYGLTGSDPGFDSGIFTARRAGDPDEIEDGMTSKSAADLMSHASIPRRWRRPAP